MARSLGGSATTSNLWTPATQPVAQVKDFVLGAGAFEVGDRIVVKIYNRSYVYTAASTVVDTVGDAFVTAANALSSATYPQMALFTWSYTSGSNTITATCDTAGIEIPITIALQESDGTAETTATIDGGASSTGTNSTPATGPNHIDSAQNWSLGVAPIDDDEVVFANSSISALYGLDQNGITPDLIRVDADYYGQAGLPRFNAYGTETAERFVKYTGSADCAVVIGDGVGDGPNYFNLNLSAGAAVVDVIQTGRPSHGDFAFTLIGTAITSLKVAGGYVGLAPETGQVSTCTTTRITHNPEKIRPRVTFGPGVTWTTITNSGGDLHTETAGTTVTIENGGTWEHLDGAITTANIDGHFYLNSDGTITTANIYKNGVLDLSRSGLAVAITNLKLWAGSKVIDPLGLISSFAPVLQGCSLHEVTIIRPKSKTYTES